MNAQTFKTADIHVAAALLAVGHKLLEVQKTGHGNRVKAFFVFEEGDDLRADILDYTNDELQLPPRKVFTRLRELKSMVHNL